MKSFLLFYVLLLGFFPKCLAQPQWTVTLSPGDSRVYRQTSSYGSGLYVFGCTRGDTDGTNDTVVVNEGIRVVQYRINQRGMIESFASRYRSDVPIPGGELYPVSYPNSDTLSLRHYDVVQSFSGTLHRYRITRRFDTTLFNTAVSGYTMICDTTNLRIEKTVVDIFGLIYMKRNDSSYSVELRLNSAIIKGKRNNWGTSRRRYMPLCKGNIYQRFISNGTVAGLISTYRIDRDTTINGKIYYVFLGQGYSNSGELREDSGGVYQSIDGQEQPLISSDATIGSMYTDRYADLIAVDTFSREINHQLRRVVHFSAFGIIKYTDIYWTEGFGITNFHYWVLENFLDTLTYANICDEEYGKLVSVPTPAGVRQRKFSLSQNYPNPFSSSTAISYHLSVRGHVRLEVFDMLGRKVATLVDEEKEAGEYTSKFSIRSSSFRHGEPSVDIHPGVYIYKLSTAYNSQVKKMIFIQ